MISFSCPHCGKLLRVKDDLVGKKGKCPNCAQFVAAPVVGLNVAVSTSESGRRLSNPTKGEPRTLPPPDSARESPTLPPGNQAATLPYEFFSMETVGVSPTGSEGVAAELTDFLAPPQQPDEIGRLGPYRVLGVLGRGGMGVVFRAEDPALQRMIALKAMLPGLAATGSSKERFLREARAAAAVQDDHIVHIYQVGEDRGAPFLAMEFLQGEPLDARLEREIKLPVAEVIRIGKETCLGLGAAHDKGLIHRDIKPANLWIDLKNSRVKILDFGLARAMADATNLTQSGAIMGTPAYMAPEQARAEPVDHRSDLFSLGCVLYRMASGEMPFKGATTISILAALALDTPKPLHELCPEIPRALSDLVMRLLAKQPADRLASAEEVVRALDNMKVDPIPVGQKVTQTGKTATKSAPSPTMISAGKADRRTITSQVASPSKQRRKGSAAAKTGVLLLHRPKSRKGRTPLLIGLGLLLLAALALGAAVFMLRVETPNGTLLVEVNDPETEARIRDGKLILTGPDGQVRYTLSSAERDKKINAGPYKIHVEGADGLVLDTSNFTLKKGEKVTVHVTAAPKATATNTDAGTAKSGDPDRAAAEWVLSAGGVVRLNGEEREITAVADLPPQTFRLTYFGFYHNTPVIDADLIRFKDCQNLTGFNLWFTQVSDVGLANFKDRDLTEIGIGGTQVTDAGLATFKDCKNLTFLDLVHTQVGDGGLANFKNCKNLATLGLGETQVSDASAAYIKDCKSLTALSLQKTKVSAAMIAELRKALPGSRIVWDGGAAESPPASSDADRRGAGWALSIGGTVHVNGENRKITAVADMPREPFQLTAVLLADNKQATDATLVSLAGCTNLTGLDLSGTQVGDAGLAHFAGSKNLTFLRLIGTKVSDAGLANFKDCKNLKHLNLMDTQLSDAGLAPVEGFKDLKSLNLRGTKVTAAKFEQCKKALPQCRIEWIAAEPPPGGDGDRILAKWVLSIGGTISVNEEEREIKTAADLPSEPFRLTAIAATDNKQVNDVGLALFKDCTNLKHLDLRGDPVSDVGLSNFKNCKNLTLLWIQRTQVSDAGLAYFKDCKNLAYLDLLGTKVSDAGMAHFKGCQNMIDLCVADTRVSSVGLANFKDCTNLVVLWAYDTQIGDAGLANLKDCKKLTKLNLFSTRVTDAGLALFKDSRNFVYLNVGNTKATNAGLANFKDCKDLYFLGLENTKVSNTGIALFVGCVNLTELYLRKTNVTAAKIVEIKKALSKCKIYWDGGVIE